MGASSKMSTLCCLLRLSLIRPCSMFHCQETRFFKAPRLQSDQFKSFRYSLQLMLASRFKTAVFEQYDGRDAFQMLHISIPNNHANAFTHIFHHAQSGKASAANRDKAKLSTKPAHGSIVTQISAREAQSSDQNSRAGKAGG